MAEDKPASSRKTSPLVYFGGGFLIASALWLAANRLLPGEAQPAPSSEATALARQISDDTTRLGLKPHASPLVTDQSIAARDAVRKGDYAQAERIGAEILAQSRLQLWRFYPFNYFVGGFTRGTDGALLDHLNQWIGREPDSALAHLLRAEYYRRAAWAARGEGFAATVSPQDMQAFGQDLARSFNDARASIRADGNVPFSYYELLRVSTQSLPAAEAEGVFQESIGKFPGYYELYHWRLDSLVPKWGGSLQAMYDFTDRYAGGAPAKSPLKLLYLQLYVDLLDAAWVNCERVHGELRDQCMSEAMKRLVRPGLEDHVAEALDLYKSTDPLQFNQVAGPILGSIANSTGNAPSAGAILQLAASAMGGEMQMNEEHPGKNNYLIDLIAGKTWQSSQYYDNAEHKYLEALSDLQHFDFPSEQEKDIAMANVYSNLQSLAEDTAQFEKLIVYRNAVEAVSGTNYYDAPQAKCFAYFRLKHYTEAVQECTRQIDGDNDTLPIRYWRARAYDLLGQLDPALQDYGMVADSESNFRTSAAIDMSVIYGKKNDAAGQLASMNSHSYLFDVENQEPDDLAVAFNNRCYAYMKLGRLHEALDDCTTSLKYGKIPDAFQKQQALIQQLAAK